MGQCCDKGPGVIEHPDNLIYNKHSIKEVYDFGEVIGKGAFGSVVKGMPKAGKASKDSNKSRAIKCISNNSEGIDVLTIEIDILAGLNHPNVIMLYEVFQDEENMYLVMEYADGGDLLDIIMEAEHFQEAQAAHVTQQVFRSILYLHGQHVAHRDIKCENFLCQAKGPIESAIIKLVDFGTARKFEPGELMETALGTPMYMAPEVLRSTYGTGCDVWSTGVLMYIMLCGCAPFQGEDDTATLKLISSAPLKFPSKSWQGVSSNAMGLIRQLIERDVKKRLTAALALKHAWFSEGNLIKVSDSSLDQAKLQQRLGAFCGHSKFKKVVLELAARQVSEKDIGGLRDIFMSLDHDHSGIVSKAELKEALSKTSGDNLDSLLTGLDADGDGSMDYREFLAAMLDANYYRREDVLQDVFRLFDEKGVGSIGAADIQRVLSSGGVKWGAISLEEMFAELGKTTEDRVTYDDFKTMMLADPAGGISRKSVKHSLSFFTEGHPDPTVNGQPPAHKARVAGDGAGAAGVPAASTTASDFSKKGSSSSLKVAFDTGSTKPRLMKKATSKTGSWEQDSAGQWKREWIDRKAKSPGSQSGSRVFSDPPSEPGAT